MGIISYGLPEHHGHVSHLSSFTGGAAMAPPRPPGHVAVVPPAPPLEAAPLLDLYLALAVAVRVRGTAHRTGGVLAEVTQPRT